jgi:hypothetical protein
MSLSGGAGALEPAFGTVDSLILHADNSTGYSVQPTSVATLDLGYLIAGPSLALWAGIEFVSARRRRRTECHPGPTVPAETSTP